MGEGDNRTDGEAGREHTHIGLGMKPHTASRLAVHMGLWRSFFHGVTCIVRDAAGAEWG